MATEPAAPVGQHRWSYFALGRRCELCGLVQQKSEYDDSVPCDGPKALIREAVLAA